MNTSDFKALAWLVFILKITCEVIGILIFWNLVLHPVLGIATLGLGRAILASLAYSIFSIKFNIKS